MSGAIPANNMQFDKNTTFQYDGSAQNLASNGGFTKLVSWQDIP